MKKNIIKIICFIMIMFILAGSFYKSFSFKYNDGIYGLKEFYGEKRDSIDVMFFGSSHMFVNVNPNILWKEYGMAGFDLCGSVQPLWNTYYYLKEALKTQDPSVVVLDCFGAVGCTDDYIDHSRIIKNNFGLKPSVDKLNSVKVSSPRDTWADYMLEYPTFHSRYTDITDSDFQSGNSVDYIDYNCWKGAFPMYHTTEQNCPDVEEMSGVADLTDKNEKYLRKIIELAQKQDVSIMLMVAPYVLSNEDMKIYNTISEIADEYNIGYVNFNYYYDEMDLDFSKDYADGSHMNYKGSEKFSKYLGNYLKDRYNIPDRRKDKNYQSYDQMFKYYKQFIYDQELTEQEDFEGYLHKLQNDNYIIVFSTIGQFENLSNYDGVIKSLLDYGIDLGKSSGNDVWIIKNGKPVFSSQGKEEYCWHERVGKYDVLTVSSGDGTREDKWNSTAYQRIADGIYVFVYDTLTESFVESVCFKKENICCKQVEKE